MTRRGLAAIVFSLKMLGLAGAGSVTADPLPKTASAPVSPAEIILSHGGTQDTVSIAEIEALPRAVIALRGKAGGPLTRFEGPLLGDVLELIGAAETQSITVRASDGYAADIPREDWTRWPIVLATRANGQPLTVRQRGPARILYPADRFPDLDDRVYIDRSVWLIREIEW